MAEQKTRPSGDVEAFIEAIEDEGRRADSRRLIAMMREASGEPPVLWGTMVGFGAYHYRYATGHEGDAFLVGFAPRKGEFSLYLMGAHFPEAQARCEALLSRLGKHRRGKACLYVKRLGDIDLTVLRELIDISITQLRETYPPASRP